MKGIIVVFVIVFLGISGLFVYKALLPLAASPATMSYQTEAITLTGVIASGKGDDYQYVIMAGGKTIGITSQRLDFSSVVGKPVRVTGQYSGNTFYADTVTPQ